MKYISLISTVFLSCAVAKFALANTLPNLSGQYKCTGVDSHDGKYSGVATFTLDPKSITPQGAGYNWSLKEDDGQYTGMAVFNGKYLAIYFANVDATKKDYGLGIAKFNGKTFTKYYYEPQYAGYGSHGLETCTKVK
jgi:hypothetical protein